MCLAHYRYIHLLTQRADWRQAHIHLCASRPEFLKFSTIWGWIILLYIVSIPLTSVYSMPITPTQPQFWKWKMSCYCRMSPSRQNGPLLRTTVLDLKWRTSWRPSLLCSLSCLRAKDLSAAWLLCSWTMGSVDFVRQILIVPWGFPPDCHSPPLPECRAGHTAGCPLLGEFLLPGRGTTQQAGSRSQVLEEKG